LDSTNFYANECSVIKKSNILLVYAQVNIFSQAMGIVEKIILEIEAIL